MVKHRFEYYTGCVALNTRLAIAVRYEVYLMGRNVSRGAEQVLSDQAKVTRLEFDCRNTFLALARRGTRQHGGYHDDNGIPALVHFRNKLRPMRQ
jgi:hypothetical protein